MRGLAPFAVMLALAVPIHADDPPPKEEAPLSTEQRLDELDQKVRVLERKEELVKEAAEAAGRDGFSIRSADGAFVLRLRGYVQVDARFAGYGGHQRASRVGSRPGTICRYRQMNVAVVNLAAALDLHYAGNGNERQLKMEIILASPRGFCAGVNMAIESLDLAINAFGAPIYVYHEIVHNKFVVETFHDKGAIFVGSLSEVPEGSTLLFSAHGFRPRFGGSRTAESARD